jgi:CSLREA domain-containing protein
MKRNHLTRHVWRTGLVAILLVTGVFVRPARTQTGSHIYVTTTTQGVDPTDGVCSLQEAIYSANFNQRRWFADRWSCSPPSTSQALATT